ncbi:MAG: carboxypeptidase regulatory-like domain-containing protein [Gemmatimonadaceae bacterium]
MRGPLALALVLALNVALATFARAQTADVGRVRGTIADIATGIPLRAAITVTPGGRTTRADSSGRFLLNDISAGSLTISASYFGYRIERRTVQLSNGETIDINFTLTSLPHSLSTVRTTATRSAEVEQFAAPAGVATISMSRRELSTVPAVGETDVLRAVSLLPGVAARNDFWAGFNIRGGESDQTQVRLDGLPVISPFHLGGLFSTFIPDAVQNVDAHVGALPASYGGRLSGALDVSSAEETNSGVHGAVDVTAVSTSAKIGGAVRGLGTPTPGSWNFAARRTYVDVLADLLRGKGSFPYHFQDAQLHVATHVRGGGTLNMTAYAGTDLLNPTAQDGTVFADSGAAFRFQWGNQLAGFTFTQPFGKSTEFVQRVSYSAFSTSYNDENNGAQLFNRISAIRFAGNISRRFGGVTPKLTLNAGYEFSLLRTRYNEHISAQAADDAFGTDITIDDTLITQRTHVASAYGELLWAPSTRFSVRGGLRVDDVSHTASTGLSPRLAVKFRARERLSFSSAIGRYSQWTHAVRNEDLPIRIVDIWFVSDSTVPVSTGTERVVGGEYWFNDNNLIRLDVYTKKFQNLIEPASTVDPRLRPSELRSFGGTSNGVELLLRHVTTEKWGGWIAYSYGKSTREQNGESYFAAHDRRHDLNIVGNYQWNDRYTFGARLGVASGTPYTGWGGTYSRWSYDPIARRWRNPGFSSDARNEQVRTTRNGERYPAYSRLDVSAHRAFLFRGNEADAFVNLVNVFDTQNVLAYSIDNATSPPVLRGLSQLPFLPSLGVRVTF